MTVWSALHAQLHQILRSRLELSTTGQLQHLLPQNSRILIAVSGGQDSQALLRLLIDLQPKWQWQLHSVHCNHRWRTDAADNAAFINRLTEQWGVPCTVHTADVPSTSEATARTWRYQMLQATAQATDSTHVVTGHTASDRAETLLYNLVRGSGTDGLQALSWYRPLSETAPDISLVRPLLDFTRAQTTEFCQQFHLPIWHDQTNCDRTYARNRLRLDVLPLLRSQFNPQVESALAHTAEILAADVAYLEATAAALKQECFINGKIQREVLRTAPLALQRRVIRQSLMAQLAITPQFEHIEKVVALLQASNRSQTDPLPGGTIAIVDHPWIVFALD